MWGIQLQREVHLMRFVLFSIFCVSVFGQQINTPTQLKNQNLTDPRTFNAQGNGTSDDSIPLQNAVNASTTRILDGSNLTYNESNLTLKSNLVVQNIKISVKLGSATPTAAFIIDGTSTPLSNIT